MSECFTGGGGAQAVTDYTGYGSFSGQLANIYNYTKVLSIDTGKTASQIKSIVGIITLGTGGAYLTKFDEEKTFLEPTSGRSYKATMCISGTGVSLYIASADAQFSSPTVRGVIAYN